MYSSKLSVKSQEIIEDKSNIIFVSAISFWKISLKHSLGKLEALRISPEALPDLAIQTGFKLLPLLPAEAANYHQLDTCWHKDPFGRMLIWQAIQQNASLISKDENISKYQASGLKIIW
nr:type II toxin-antitoxin system VapC family toxin [Pedobacter chinensis]